jgi:hypothetical protein
LKFNWKAIKECGNDENDKKMQMADDIWNYLQKIDKEIPFSVV